MGGRGNVQDFHGHGARLLGLGRRVESRDERVEGEGVHVCTRKGPKIGEEQADVEEKES